ncbi:MAG: serine/threonine-protein kinase [Coleofasciculaceae cyanobacterium]
MLWTPGQQLKSRPYLVENVLGFGGFGVTYKVRHLILDQYFVIKTPNAHLQHDPDYDKYLKQFIKEGQRLAHLSADPHPHIVRVSDLFEEDGIHCLVMDFIPGESLFQLVQRQGALAEHQAVNIISQIGDALTVVHQAGLVHRDATPLNVMMRRPDKAVLIDFGIAKGSILTTSTSIDKAGNQGFAPYEQIGQGSREPTVDVYSLAASLYYVVTGTRPTTSFERKLLNQKLVPPQQLISQLSDRVNQTILYGMALEPGDRPSSVREWLDLLEPQVLTNLIPINQNASAVKPRSEVGVRFNRLKELLEAENWKEADQETRNIIIRVAKQEEKGWLKSADIETFPCAELQTLDHLWLTYSDGRFGFSVQEHIWQEMGGKVDLETESKLGDCLGWRKEGSWLSYSNLDFSQEAPLGHLPASPFLVWWRVSVGVVILFLSRTKACKI